MLFIPSFLGTPSHFIPLVKLYQRLDAAKYESAFFVPVMTPASVQRFGVERYLARAEYYYCGAFYSHFDIPVLPGRRAYSVASELRAYSDFDPDVIVDDCNLTTALTSQIAPKPRITILRTRTISNGARADPGYRHTLDPMIGTVRPPPGYALVKPPSVDGFFQADAYVIPGIDTIERNHPNENEQSRTFFCGPLILDEEEECIFQSDALRQFFDANAGRRIAYVTLGFSPGSASNPRLIGCFRYLLDSQFSVVTNVSLAALGGSALLGEAGERIFSANALPMHYVTARAEVMIHVGGSGMYHYPLLHRKPAITVGTQTYDREAIAATLAALGLSIHIPSPAETGQFESLFRNAVDRLRRKAFPFDAGLGGRLERCRQRILQVTQEFDMAKVIATALRSSPRRALS